jgi:hypothetical protein
MRWAENVARKIKMRMHTQIRYKVLGIGWDNTNIDLIEIVREGGGQNSFVSGKVQ